MGKDCLLEKYKIEFSIAYTKHNKTVKDGDFK